MGWPARTPFFVAHFAAIALSSALALVTCTAVAPSARAEDKCKLIPVGELPVTMTGLRPLITAQINGKDARFVLDSGAFWSVMSAATATEFNLKMVPFGLKMVGVGGVSNTSAAAVQEFGLMGLTFRNAEFLVGGSETGLRSTGWRWAKARTLWRNSRPRLLASKICFNDSWAGCPSWMSMATSSALPTCS